MEKVKEYKGTKKGYKNYKEPVQEYANKKVKMRLYCAKKGCYVYLKGTLGYNGCFKAETGQFADLRDEEFRCERHSYDDKLGEIVEEKLEKIKNGC